VDQAAQLTAGAIVVAAYAAVQMRLIDPLRPLNLVANFAGTAVLATVAVIHQQWGFVLTNGFWALISLWSLTRNTPP
jgi:tetrahydromethanopterin S-methyltransferase subunit H